jgi:DNA-binding CsgD family transcriptional regulator
LAKSKLNHKPLKTDSLYTEEAVYLQSCLSSDKYIPLNLISSKNINLRRVIELERFRIENEAIFKKLSKTEINVMTLLAEGHKRIEIGEVLFISPNTVRTHRNNIYKKLSISRFSDLLLFARAFDLI